MSVLTRISLIIVVVLTSLWAGAQLPVPNTASNLRHRTVKVGADTLKIDSLSIIPNTFSIVNIPPDDYKIDYVGSKLFWIKKPDTDSVTLHYRVFPYQLNFVAQRLPLDSVLKQLYVIPYQFNDRLAEEQRGIFDFGTLKAEGSFGRQISFGNSQDAVLNSTLNLQLSGMLGDSIEIQAAITDNNIPIQPDGTTQQLNEFDRVFLQFRKGDLMGRRPGWQLSLGDIDIRQDKSFFLNFYKRLQGISFQTANPISKNLISKTLASGSIAKGKFTRNVFQGLEGNQGPYRLTGANNEIFFIVLANTERVFLDGELLQRGEDQDYVINYNTAEVTFTPKHMITKDSRIQIEFEYADRNYLNANLYLSQEMDFGKKVKLNIGLFSNSDAKNSQINQVLDNKQKQFLANLGDSIQNAFYPAATPDTFAAGKILYEKIYVDNGGVIDSFYQYSTDPTLAKYNLSFSEVGQGKGNYVPDLNGANGKVYRYVTPINGVMQGNFEPVTILVTPKKQQVINLGVDYAIDKNTSLKTELAMSDYDPNTFSKVGKGNNKGFAARFLLNNKKVLNAVNKLMLNTELDYQFVQNKFRPIERLRTVEFTRDWGLPLVVSPATENILKASAGLSNNKGNSVSYQFMNYHRSDHYNGFQNSLAHTWSNKGWTFNDQLILTNFNDLNNKGAFFRPTIDFSKQMKALDNWRAGFNYSLQQNSVRNKLSDTLTPLAFSFHTYSLYLKSDEMKKNHYGVTFSSRTDKYPVNKDFIRGDRSYNLNLQTELLSNPDRRLFLNATYRRLKVFDSTVTGQKDDQTVLGRAEYVMNEWKGALSGNVLYEVGAGQEQKRDYAYLEVPAGTGQYAWIDYNNDGVQQLNEFELAAFPDQAKFIRIFTPTNEFVKANYITFNYSLNFNPKVFFVNSEMNGFEKFISRFNLLTSLQVNKKSISKNNFEFNPFKYKVNDTALITSGNILANTLSFNRFSSKWGMDISNLRNNSQSLLTYGYESSKRNDWTIKWRWNISRTVTFNINGKKGSNALYTPKFANRNYQLKVFDIQPQLSYIKGTTFRATAGYTFDRQKNLPLYGGEKSLSNSLDLETKYNILQNSSITGKFTFSNINYDYPANSTVSYIMLNGLLPGSNFLWSLSFTKRLLNNLELNFQYDGRKSANSRAVHVGRASITALF
ncbi:MAG: hypothetical protein LC128_06820 [Chitinophagales bacterium]|nr:hypothetical protein [Chitinophagales bacterium]